MVIYGLLKQQLNRNPAEFSVLPCRKCLHQGKWDLISNPCLTGRTEILIGMMALKNWVWTPVT